MRLRPALREQELIAAAVRRDEDAVVALIKTHERSVASGLRSAGLSPSDPLYEDAQNQALMAIWQQLPTFRGDAAVGTWMFAIARRTALSRTIDPEARERRRWRRNAERTTPLDLVEPAEEEHLVERDLLEQVLDRLSPDDLEILMLRVGLELPLREVAEVLSLSEAGAKARYRRARQRAVAISHQLEAACR